MLAAGLTPIVEPEVDMALHSAGKAAAEAVLMRELTDHLDRLDAIHPLHPDTAPSGDHARIAGGAGGGRRMAVPSAGRIFNPKLQTPNFEL